MLGQGVSGRARILAHEPPAGPEGSAGQVRQPGDAVRRAIALSHENVGKAKHPAANVPGGEPPRGRLLDRRGIIALLDDNAVERFDLFRRIRRGRELDDRPERGAHSHDDPEWIADGDRLRLHDDAALDRSLLRSASGRKDKGADAGEPLHERAARRSRARKNRSIGSM